MKYPRKGFALIEFIFSLGLIFILIAVAFWAVNPIGRFQLQRDNKRFSALSAIKEAVDSAVSEGADLGNTFGVPSSTVSIEVTQAVDGSGWVPMNLSGHLESLSTDPLNGETFTDVLGSRVLAEYQFISDGTYYILRTHLEAEVNKDKYAEDGNDNSWWEVGTAPGFSTYFGL